MNREKFLVCRSAEAPMFAIELLVDRQSALGSQ